MQRPFLIAASLLWLVGCRMDVPVVRERTGTGWIDTTVHGESYGDWCIPPPYDPRAAPLGVACSDLHQGSHTVYSGAERAARSALTIVLDRSLSMNDSLPGSTKSKWDSVQSAITFLDEEPRGFVDFLSWLSFAANDTTDVSANCSENAYRNIQTRNQSAATINVSNRDPRPATAPLRPTAAAILAAVDKARQTAVYGEGNTTVPLIILITDGPPQGCGKQDDINELAAILQEENPPSSRQFVPIHVIQLGDDYDLAPLAIAGGTGAARVISGGAVDRQLLWNLRHILYPVTNGCTMAVDQLFNDPTARAPSDFEMKVEIGYHLNPDDRQSYVSPPHLPSAEACDLSPSGGFWVTEIEPLNYLVELCPCTCGVRGTFWRVHIFGYCDE